MIMKSSPESYLCVDRDIRSEEELCFSVSSQEGMLSRRFFKKYGIDLSRLESLKNIYLVYIEDKAFVSEISEEQMELLKQISVSLEYK